MPASVVQENKGVTSAQGEAGGNSGPAFKQSISPTLQSPRGDVERGSIWDVRVIRVGKSLNGPIYPAETLREAAQSGVFEGVDVNVYKWGSADPTAGGVAHLESKVAEQDPRGLFGNVVGVLENVYFNEKDQALDGTLTLIDGNTREKMLEAYDAGKIGEAAQRNIFGFSIDAEGPRGPDGWTVLKIANAESLDMVTKPAAGGQTLRLVASADSPDPGLEASAALPEPIQEAKIVTVGPYVHPENGDGFAVFLAGRPVEWHHQRDQADSAAEIKDRLALVEAEEPESPVPQLQENASKISSDLNGLAERIKSAPEDQVGSLLMEASQLIEGYKAELGIEEAAPVATPGMVAPRAPALSSAQSDEFARMAAGIKEAIGSDAVQANPKLREALETALGEKIQESSEQRQIREMGERLQEQAIQFAFAPLREGLHNPAMVLSQISREGVKISEDGQTVTGLKEAVSAFVKDNPFFKITEAVVPEAAAAPAAAPAVPVQEAKTPPLGQNIPLRESLEDMGPTISLTETQARRKLAGYKRQMAKGKTEAVVKHRNLKAQMTEAGLL